MSRVNRKKETDLSKTSPTKIENESTKKEGDLMKTTGTKKEAEVRKSTGKTIPELIPKPQKLNQREMDSSSYRLSKIPQKFQMTKIQKAETSTSYAVNFYNNNPEIPIDTRLPKEKLDEIDSKLLDDTIEIDDNERFDLLVQQKSLRFLVFGEVSREAVQSMISIGEFYNKQGHPESAMRHLNKAQQTAKSLLLSADDSLRLALEMATSHLITKTNNKSDQLKNINNAEKLILPHSNTYSEDLIIIYRRDSLIADILNKKQKFEESLEFYIKACEIFIEAHNGQKTQELADLYFTTGNIAKKIENIEKTKLFYNSAYDLYLELGMDDNAQKVKELIPITSNENNIPKTE